MIAIIRQCTITASEDIFSEYLGYVGTLPFHGQPELQEQARAWAVEVYLATSGREEVSTATTIQGVELSLHGQDQTTQYMFIDFQD